MRLDRPVVGALLLCASFHAGAQLSFAPHESSVGLGAYHPPIASMCMGLAVADADGDGDPDLLIPTGPNEPVRLLHNDGTGSFIDVTIEAGLTKATNARAALFIDYDNDGDLDILAASDMFQIVSGPGANLDSNLHLFRLGSNGKYTDVTASSGLDYLIPHPLGYPLAAQHVGGVAAADLDNDGDVDILVCLWGGSRALFRNNGDGTFANATPASGLADVTENDWAPIIHDFNDDGLLDIFCAVDFHANRLFINKGDLTFEDQAPAFGLDNAFNDMGAAIDDIDADGDLDLYIANIAEPDNPLSPYYERHNVLYRDDGPDASPRFTEVAQASGVAIAGWSWGCDFADLDNDADSDLIVTNGWRSPTFVTDRSPVYLNNGDGSVFSDVAISVGFDDTRFSSGMVTADLDGDGDLDAVQVYDPGVVRVFENTSVFTPGVANWIVVRPRRTDADTFSIGAVVRVYTDGKTLTRLITAGTSILSQKPYEAHFGLGASDRIDRIEITWPDGLTRIVHNADLNTVITIETAKPQPPSSRRLPFLPFSSPPIPHEIKP